MNYHPKRIHVMLQLVTCFLVINLIGRVDGNENWTSYRGPSDQGRADEAKLPIKWGEKTNVVWKIPIKGKAWSSPVIWGDRIFLTNAPTDGKRLSVVCIDKNSGKVIYNKQMHTVAAPQFCHPFNSYASPSPVVEDGRLYISFGSPYLACLEPETGKVIWERTDFVCNHFRGAGSSPVIYKDRLFLHFDGSDEQYVVALNKKTGETIWRTNRTVDFDDINPKTGKPDRDGDWRKAFSTPVVMEVAGRPILISLGSMALYGYDVASGKELWRVEFIGSHSGACRPLVKNEMIYAPIGSGREVWAIRPNGKGVVTETHVAWKLKRAAPRRPSVLLIGALIYMVDDSGVAACVDSKTGEPVWIERLGGNFSASPIYAHGRIYFMDESGKATVIKADRKFEVLAKNVLDDGFMASPAVSGNALFVRSRTHLYRIEDKP